MQSLRHPHLPEAEADGNKGGAFPKEDFMNTGILEPVATRNYQTAEPAGMSEVVRGECVRLLERLGLLVAEQNVMLDMTGVVRIDAAGISTLLTLYCRAREAGNRFALVNVPARIVEILSVVGLEPLLLSHNPVQDSQYEPELCRTAA